MQERKRISPVRSGDGRSNQTFHTWPALKRPFCSRSLIMPNIQTQHSRALVQQLLLRVGSFLSVTHPSLLVAALTPSVMDGKHSCCRTQLTHVVEKAGAPRHEVDIQAVFWGFFFPPPACAMNSRSLLFIIAPVSAPEAAGLSPWRRSSSIYVSTLSDTRSH